MRCLWLATVLSLSGFLELASAIIANTTVDDDQLDGLNTIIYQPEGAWQQGRIGGCDSCLPPPITGLASMNTFHGSLFNPNNKKSTKQVPPFATLVFFGSSVSVNCILSNGLNPSGYSEMTFTIDGIQRDNFVHIPSGSVGFLPKNVFASGPLELANHTLVIKNGGISGGSSLVILDYITYSYDDLTSSSTSTLGAPLTSQSAPTVAASLGATRSSNTAAIAGGVIAALAVVLLIALALLYTRYRRNQHRSNVPISASIFSPIGRIGRLWSEPPKPPPDMAPVPFPSPAAHRISHPSTPQPPAPAPTPAPSAAPPGSRLSRISFNANLLVGRFQRRPPPPAILTRQVAPTNARLSVPGAAPGAVPASPALLSGNPLLRQASAQPEPNNVVASIQQWQRRTQEETANEPIPIIHPLDMSEVDLSSHYDESSLSSPPAPPPAPPPRTPQPPQRRFTVMNN